MEEIKIYPPLNGIVVEMTNVPDPVFSQKMVGDGVAIEPLDNKIYAPITGTIKSIHRALHAITFINDDVEVLVHIGLDTVNLGGIGFKYNVTNSTLVKAGDVIGEFDIKYLSEHAKSLISPIIVSGMNTDLYIVSKCYVGQTNSNTPILELVAKTTTGIKSEIDHQNSSNSELIKSTVVRIQNKHGIHARPAALISNELTNIDGEVLIEKNSIMANARSVTALLSLAINKDDHIYIHANNHSTIDRIINLINKLHDEDPGLDDVVNQKSLVDAAIIDNKYYGISASVGLAIGKLTKKNDIEFAINENGIDLEYERSVLLNAFKKLTQEIEGDLGNLLANDLSYQGILGAHLQILKDPQILSDCESLIELGKTASYAIWSVIENNCEILKNSGSQLLLERQTDFRDIRNRLLGLIEGNTAGISKFDQPTVLLADELTPNDMVKLDSNVVGLVSILGGATSHVAILAKVKGIPLLVGVNKGILNNSHNQTVILNTKLSYIDLKPDSDSLKLALESIKNYKEEQEIFLKNIRQDAVTLDGYKIECLANITGEHESDNIKNSGASGVGLFRTEFIYFNREFAPSVEEQSKIYAKIQRNLDGMPFTIRTLDAGGDKPVEYLQFIQEQNPALGVRGIRLGFEYEELLIEQLTAILLQNQSNIKIMLPMISSLVEYRYVRKLLEELKIKLNVVADIKLGIMVEVPSVCLLADSFAKEVDFFSIGSNDLTQYTLAIDREHAKLAKPIDHLHPAVLKNIQLTVLAAQKYNKEVSVCGLMASEKLAIPLLVGLGIKQLSMNCNVIAENKGLIRTLKLEVCQNIAKHCLSLTDAKEVEQYLLTKFN